MQPRIDARRVNPKVRQHLLAINAYLHGSSLGNRLLHLVELRASQINGCAQCLDMHSQDARAEGESEQRLYTLAAWREAPFFDERERAALEWTEALTHLSPEGVPDATYERARAVFSEKDLSDLTYAIIAINGWNRANVAFRTVPGALDAELGLDKANLA